MGNDIERTAVIAKKKVSIVLGWLVCALGAIFYTYEYLLRIEPSVMVHELMQHFHITAAHLGMIAAVYYYAYTPMQLLVGVLIDRYGTRIIITLAIAACTLGSLLFSVSDSIFFISAGRFLIGFGSAFAFVSVLKLAAEWLPKHHFALFAGFTVTLGMTGAMVGDVELSLLVHKIGWRETLHIGTIFGLFLIPLIWFLVRDAPKWHSEGKGQKTTFRETFIGLLAIIRNPQMWISGIIGMLLFVSLTVFADLWGISFIQSVYNFTSHNAAITCSMVFAGWLVGAPVNGWLSDQTRTRRLPLVIGGFLAGIVAVIIVIKPLPFSMGELSLLLFLFGLFSSVQIVCFAISRENNPTHVAATSVAFTNFLIMMGGLVLQPLMGKLLDLGWTGLMHEGVRVYSAGIYQHAFLFMPVCVFVGTILTVFLRETYPAKDWDEFD